MSKRTRSNASKAAGLLGRRSVEARIRKWGEREFVLKLREWGRLGGRPKGNGKKQRATAGKEQKKHG
jgi:hypothetical protein